MTEPRARIPVRTAALLMILLSLGSGEGQAATQLLEARVKAAAAVELRGPSGTAKLRFVRAGPVAEPRFVLALCGDGVLEPRTEACDDGNRVSGDLCSATCELEQQLRLFGTARGGRIDLDVDGITIAIPTTPGASALQVLFELAAAINDDPVLRSQGIAAGVVDGELTTNGALGLLVIQDAGLGSTPRIVPGTGPWLLAAQAVLLILLVPNLVRRRRSASFFERSLGAARKVT